MLQNRVLSIVDCFCRCVGDCSWSGICECCCVSVIKCIITILYHFSVKLKLASSCILYISQTNHKMLTLTKLCPEIIVAILTKLNNLEYQINFALTCKHLLTTLMSNSFMIDATLDRESKYHTNILVNLIQYYNYNPSRLHITNSSNLMYLTKDILSKCDFAHVALPSLTNSMSNEIAETFINEREDRINVISYHYEFTLDQDNCSKNYFLNNLDDDNNDDYNEMSLIKSYVVPWFVTQINFDLDCQLVCNIGAMNDINRPSTLNNNELNVYSYNNDYKISYNCINPTTRLDAWLSSLKSKYPQLRTIKVSSKVLESKMSHEDNNINLITYKWYEDPFFYYELFEAGFITIFALIVITLVYTLYYVSQPT